MLKFNFLLKFSIVIIFAFILFTIIGTLAHEFGHIAVAKFLGYETQLNSGSMSHFQKGYYEDKDVKEIGKVLKDYSGYKYEDLPKDIKIKVEELWDKVNEKFPRNKSHDLWVTIGGPAQTLITSFIGLLVLFIRRKKWKNKFKIVDRLAVFMSLFALREVFNFVHALYSLIVHSKSNFHGDEFRISRYLGFNEWVIPSITLLLGLLISCYVIFKIIPIKYRFTFIVSGLIGGVAGFAIWFGFLGAALFNL